MMIDKYKCVHVICTFVYQICIAFVLQIKHKLLQWSLANIGTIMHALAYNIKAILGLTD